MLNTPEIFWVMSGDQVPLDLNHEQTPGVLAVGNDPALSTGTTPTVPTGLLPDWTNTSQSSLREIIRRERRVELGFEFHRYFDVMRYGKDYAQTALRDKPSFKYETNRYFPIPQSERDTNKKLVF